MILTYIYKLVMHIKQYQELFSVPEYKDIKGSVFK